MQPWPGPAQPLAPRPASVSAVASVKFAFASPDWMSNLLLGAVFLLLPIVGPMALNGWLVEGHQRLVRRHPSPLPKLSFNDFSRHLERGVGPFVVQLVLLVPILVIAYGGLGGALVAIVLTSRGPAFPAGALAGIGVAALFALALALVGVVVSSAGTTHVELTEDVGASLSPARVLAYAKQTWAAVLGSMVVFGLCATGLVFAGMALCLVGMYPMIVAVQVGSMHLRFQIYEQYVAGGGQPFELKPPRPLPSELPPQGWGGPPGHGAPQQGWGPPQQGWGPPQQGWGPQQPGAGQQPPYGPPPQGWGPPRA